MTHYKKLATMIFRIIGASLLVLTVISIIVAAFLGAFGIYDSSGTSTKLALAIFFFFTIPTAILGFVFFNVSRKLARIVCFDFDELDGK